MIEASKEFDKEGFNQLHQLNQKYKHLSNQYKGLDKAYKHIKDMFNIHLKKSILIEDVEKIINKIQKSNKSTFEYLKKNISKLTKNQKRALYKIQIKEQLLRKLKQKLKSLGGEN